MIRKLGDGLFVLDTRNTSYVFEILPTGQIAHLYYGKKIRIEEPSDAKALRELHSFAPGDTVYYDDENKGLSLETVKLEMSGSGKGDVDSSFVEVSFADGSWTIDFVYDSYEIIDGKPEYSCGLPGSYGAEADVQTLQVNLKDRHENVSLTLFYYIYEDMDVICRNAELTNNAQAPLVVKKLMSTQLDIDCRGYGQSGYALTSLSGAWAREMNKRTVPCNAGTVLVETTCGASSNHANPFVMLHELEAGENNGRVYGFNLIYSGNHREQASIGAFGRLRMQTGINPEHFEYMLEPGESFMSPEAVMAFSNSGFGHLSRIMHRFVREHIVRGTWKNKQRPVVFNSWESNYFDIDEGRLISLAKKASDAGIELFVMDDGWFGNRNDDSSSLGDWIVNSKKLPHGLGTLSDKIHNLNMMFGIWVEPEMVNVNSLLYKEHPDWVLGHPSRNHSEGRNQRVLNLSLEEVQDYIISAMSAVFEESKCDYVKWDYNRNFSDVYSPKLSPQKQGELSHRYILGLYRIMKTLTTRFPNILFEGCASGGNRFDLGILSYFPQIWASDNTDPVCRSQIQSGYSYGYPNSCVSAHVGSSPNHQTLRKTDIFTRFSIAAFGPLGYEFNISDMSAENFDRMKKQISYYKKYRQLLVDGNFYRLREDENLTEWMMVSRGGANAIVLRFRKHWIPNFDKQFIRLAGLRSDVKYKVTNVLRRVDVKDFGDLVNTMSPIHIKQDSLVHNVVAKVVKMQTPKLEVTAYGDTLMNAGIQLPGVYGGTGYSESIELSTDYFAEIYIVEKA